MFEVAWKVGGDTTLVQETSIQMTATTNPMYDHDCENCYFVGQHNGSDRTVYDLYICPNEPTVVARWGNYGADYTSGLVFIGRNEALGAAWEAALTKALAGDLPLGLSNDILTIRDNHLPAAAGR